ncbi:DUF806 family protein [Liquorilactobacillus cacaonum]|uniref:Uncharacterized protein n=1 Tax=Liquorilactobacillus cacaonum DSM 21116 TaxID=1423729 RepID=A0A0R2CTX6_9LACO|nr:DUF806 family protein [Liquorilactobacillus cacaonum]KRM91494.1 hypothetical protein FC80_GL000461 [Liquorilactobacillus cacaonum DSM 21116]
MSSLDDAKNLVSTLDQIEETFTRNIPKEVKGNTDTTVALITAVRTDPTDLGNNDYFSIERQIELQIFYSLNVDYDPEDLENKIMKLFKDSFWNIIQPGVLNTDPDTFQLYESFYLSKKYDS